MDDDFGIEGSDDDDRVQTVRTLWDCFESRSWAAARRLFVPDAVFTSHPSGAALANADEIVRAQKANPEGWHIAVRELAALSDGRVLSIVEINHPPRRFHVTSIFRFDGVGIQAIDEYGSGSMKARR